MKWKNSDSNVKKTIIINRQHPLFNSYPSQIIIDGLQYPTVEHAYQASKTVNHYVKERIRLGRGSLGAVVRIRSTVVSTLQHMSRGSLGAVARIRFAYPSLSPPKGRGSLGAVARIRLPTDTIWECF